MRQTQIQKLQLCATVPVLLMLAGSTAAHAQSCHCLGVGVTESTNPPGSSCSGALAGSFNVVHSYNLTCNSGTGTFTSADTLQGLKQCGGNTFVIDCNPDFWNETDQWQPGTPNGYYYFQAAVRDSISLQIAYGLPVCFMGPMRTSGMYTCPDCCAPSCPSGQYCMVGSQNVCRDNVRCPCGDVPTCQQTTYGWGWVCNSSCTPIVMDTLDQGFHLTSLAAGVEFRVTPDGPPLQMSWTDPNWRNGWLALDRNGNGRIDDFTELFGNLTPQPKSENPNGFLALAVFDQPANGGNGDGFIDPGDSVYSHLRVWIDANHNGISEPSELHTLPELGIFRIGVGYRLDKYVDNYGNAFRYRGVVWDDGGHKSEAVYDVVLTVQAEPAGGKK